MIVTIGDIHGDFESVERKVRQILTDRTENVNFIQLGDFGIGFRSPSIEHTELSYIDRILGYAKSKLYIIRGNHDNPIYWTSDYKMIFENIIFVQDHSYYNIDGKICFFAGGAISIDRSRRTQSVSYWKTEEYIFEEPPMTTGQLDYIFTHDVPHSISKYNIGGGLVEQWIDRDKTLKKSLIKAQNEMQKLLEFLNTINKYASWYHGHYHESNIIETNGRMVHSLGIKEYKEVR